MVIWISLFDDKTSLRFREYDYLWEISAYSLADMIELTHRFGRYGYRRISALLRDAGWQVNDKRVERLWRREGLTIRVKRKLNSTEVIDALTDLLILRGVPGYIRSENGPEFIAEAVRGWIKAVGAKTAYIEPGSPWENGYCESFNGRMPDELLNGEIFYSLHEAQIIVERWRNHYNTKRPHSALGCRPPAPEAIIPMDQRPIMH